MKSVFDEIEPETETTETETESKKKVSNYFQWKFISFLNGLHPTIFNSNDKIETFETSIKDEKLAYTSKFYNMLQYGKNCYFQHLKSPTKKKKQMFEGPSIVFESRISELEAQLTQAKIDLKKAQEENDSYKRRIADGTIILDGVGTESYKRQIENLQR